MTEQQQDFRARFDRELPEDPTIWDLAGVELNGSETRVRVNGSRALDALVAVRAFASTQGGDISAEPVRDYITDLVANLHHLADALGLDMSQMITNGKIHYDTEIAGL